MTSPRIRACCAQAVFPHRNTPPTHAQQAVNKSKEIQRQITTPEPRFTKRVPHLSTRTVIDNPKNKHTWHKKKKNMYACRPGTFRIQTYGPKTSPVRPSPAGGARRTNVRFPPGLLLASRNQDYGGPIRAGSVSARRGPLAGC